MNCAIVAAVFIAAEAWELLNRAGNLATTPSSSSDDSVGNKRTDGRRTTDIHTDMHKCYMNIDIEKAETEPKHTGTFKKTTMRLIDGSTNELRPFTARKNRMLLLLPST